jgi:arylsulfatase A-like enzyme|eukprot:COSAG02_NODE_14986_length_1217_cov_4.347048_3_plen_157_part_00
MRPEISPYGAKYMHTPNMQALADDGFVFRRMFVQQALCAPSRTVLLTGRRPDTSHVWTIGPYFRDTVGKDWVTLPQWFKEHGYITTGAGKLFHHGGPSGYLENRSTSPPTVVRSGDDYPASWCASLCQLAGYRLFGCPPERMLVLIVAGPFLTRRM